MNIEKTWPIRGLDVSEYPRIAEYCACLVETCFDGVDIPHNILIVLEEVKTIVRKIEVSLDSQKPSPEDQERFFTTPPEEWEAIPDEFKKAGLCDEYHRFFCGEMAIMCRSGWKRTVTVRQVLYGTWLIEGAEYLKEVRFSKYEKQTLVSDIKEASP